MGFGLDFWKNVLRERGYEVVEERLDIETLIKQKIIPATHRPEEVVRLYRDRYVEIAVLIYAELPSRSVCVRVARQWRSNRLYRPLLIFTDGSGRSSYAVIVRGAGLDGEARVLHIEDKLYRTDLEVLESIRHPGTPEELVRKYDTEFFPYERVRDEFFQQYRKLFEETVRIVKPVLGEKRGKEYAQRFLGRLMFLYFLQRKGWLNNDKNYIDKISGFRELNTLFYEKLNSPNGNGIPYLNGSLFEKESYLTDDVVRKIEREMDELFRKARRLFNNYNFTVDETSPLEVEVSIDPLLLGTVLENMLPEHERGEKGTFYTPVNEIGFICRKALAAWLGLEDKVEGDKLVDGLQEYINRLKERRDEREIREFRERLLSLKVCDPAVGSGGFLVVTMQTILSLIQEVEEAVGWRTDPAIYKARILPNLYGFDIEPEAVEIARLRLWLSLIVDQKRPEPLPNLDLNIMLTSDSLTTFEQTVLDEILHRHFAEKVDELKVLKEKYVGEHDPQKKAALRNRIERIQRELEETIQGKTRKGLPIELFMLERPDIIVMNPPYVRHEKLEPDDKNHYASTYNLDKKSDLYAYFMVRALQLLKDGGSAAIISSDKWLEVEYGIKLQERLKPHLLAIYGQRKRSFGADINTVITVLRKVNFSADHPIQFIYLEGYGGEKVVNHKSIPRGVLRPGKWYYLRAPKFFEEVLLSKLTHKLKDFAEIKRGFTTGANEFFYLKDITHLYEADYLANPKKFEEWGVNAKTGKELLEQGLIYVENERGERFVIDRKDVKPIVRSPKQIRRYICSRVQTFVVYTHNPGKHTMQYIRWGEQQRFNERPTCKNRKPWYALPELNPTNILLPKSWMSTIYIPFFVEKTLCDDRLYAIYPNKVSPLNLWLYLNSTLFYITVELFCRRLGGGATDIMVEDYEVMPVPNLSKIQIDLKEDVLNREPLIYYEEVKQPDRRELDKAVLRALGFPEDQLDALVDELHKAFVWVVEDRLIKAGRPLEGEEDGEDN